MKVLRVLLMSAAVLSALSAASSAGGGGPSVEEGRELFQGSGLGPGEKRCVDCHAYGKRLKTRRSGEKFIVRGREVEGLEGAVNSCLATEMGGVALDPPSAQMRSLVRYILHLTAANELMTPC